MHTYNIYCDESCHLQAQQKSPFMVIGGIRCPESIKHEVNSRITSIKRENGRSFYELKWTRVSRKTLPLYKEVINYFFDKDPLFFRAVVVNKEKVQPESYGITYDDFYYRIYFRLLERMVDPASCYKIFLDIKDTQGRLKIAKLREVLCNNQHDFEQKMINRIQEIRSFEGNLIQLTDVFIGAIQYANNFPNGGKSEAKQELLEHIKKRASLNLMKSTWPGAEKFNLFHWEARNV